MAVKSGWTQAGPALATYRKHLDEVKLDDPDAIFDLAGFDYHVIAQQIRASREIAHKEKKKTTLYTAPKLEHLSNAIIGVRLTDTIEGSSTLVIELSDPEYELAEFFDIDKDGKLDKIELNYPPGSPSWWRLTGFGMSTQAGSALQLTLTFMERPAVLLLHRRGPKKTSRGKVTRAQFLKSCVKDVKQHPLKFKSMELTVAQDIAGRKPADPDAETRVIPVEPTGTARPQSTPKKVDEPKRREDKTSGLHKGDDVTVKGVKANPNQIEQAERALDVAKQLSAPHDAAVALMMTAMGESNMGAAMSNLSGSVYGGVFAGSPSNFPDQSDTEAMAEACLKGGKGFNAPEGGLIGGVKAMKKGGEGTYRSLGHLCYVNQGNRSNFGSDKAAEDFFGKWESEAEDWVATYGDGFSGGSTYYRAQYNFQIGDEENPKERYWDGMRALAEEVRWRLFIDGRTIYFDSDMTLIRQKPAAIIRRTDPAVVGFDATWDGERDLATEMQLELICEPFAFRAGEVLKLKGFGPLSTGSTVLPKGLPGRWLIWEIDRSSGSYSSSFTLRQPERERMEPNNDQQREREDLGGSMGGGVRDVDDAMTPREIIDELVLPIARKHNALNSYGQKLTSGSVKAANDGHDQNVAGSSNTSWHKGNGVDMWAADLAYPGSDEGHVNPDGDGLADELARKWGFQVRHNHIYAFDQNIEKDGVSYQLGWRTRVGGNHFTHVHFGAKVTNPSKRKSSRENTPSGAPGYDKGSGRPD